MKNILILLFMIMSSTSVSAAEKATDKVRLALNKYAWEKRQLIVFAPSYEHRQYQLFRKLEAEFRDEFEERKLHSWHVIGNDPVKLDNTVHAGITNGISSQDFRKTYNVSKNEFRVLLIGYDQGEKLRQEKVNIDYLFSEIDQMPMRIQEMQ
ncbi:DUF4174 domain-containing protein [Cocleimonas sp. KMM 6892]|uniref:DUF4174 domain-containing protein n=1 Tax=unclassified Cocleimonas TaxID=2639732 RepID=UPI002DBA7C15|nr:MULTISPECIES: DUF4174 domain-containing protein [unclassified Cocleimonas]MEB8431577.1 DUF4174 domain-containing protein [Cocleimonas sp. KMM 6892]MEC4713651.1 DUF4174 domain-containing protein [Cocleimonas sp. KMM 6895]MEC4742982.1 DUF4174 domain-containing protein [Cocleimonas sp. KMM 6896]